MNMLLGKRQIQIVGKYFQIKCYSTIKSMLLIIRTQNIKNNQTQIYKLLMWNALN